MTDIVRYFPGAAPVSYIASGATLPLGLVIPPGQYVWQGKAYDCTREGAYRFWSPGTDRTIRIVWAGDVGMMMRSLAWCTAIGVADEGVPLAQITANARWSSPRLLCSTTANWVKYVCDSLGVQCRVVRALTAGPPSGYFDGHVMVECTVGGSRRLFDPAAGRAFGGLSLKDALPLGASVMADFAKIAGVIDVASVVESATTAGKWQAPKGQALTGDGTHPNRRGYLKIQSSGIVNPGMFQR